MKEKTGQIFSITKDNPTVAGQMHSFYERLFFPNMLYKEGYPTLVEHKIPTACIYTMNVDEKEMIEGGYRQNMELWENFLTWYYSKPLIAYAFNTYQLDDYSKYICETFNEADKAKQREEQFPKDLQNAYELGQKLLKGQT